MKKIFVFLLVLLAIKTAAMHNRAGEITYRLVKGTTYEITVLTYTNITPPIIVDRKSLKVYWGDNTFDDVIRSEWVDLPNYIRRNKYIFQHSYPGSGIYKIRMEDLSRNFDVSNIPNSINVAFTLETTLIINASIGTNNSPELLNSPVDKAARNVLFVHNPNAYDKDGDSLSYRLITCLGENGIPIPNYQLPPASNSITVNARTGDLIWDKPSQLGIYNIAIAIDEWRNGIRIGTILRDMQIEVKEANNKPPVFDPMKDICVLAGANIKFDITARDTISQSITISGSGDPLSLTVNKASFIKVDSARGRTRFSFLWQSDCIYVRKRPYTLYIRAEDDDKEVKMVDFKAINIQIVAPPPINVVLKPTNKSIFISWNKGRCTNAIGYKIYRKRNPANYTADMCNPGVPKTTGYALAATIGSANILSYEDTNQGYGLWQGVNYCYMITAIFPDGAESLPSAEVCTILVRGIPAIVKVSVDKTSLTDGVVHIQWTKPTQFDKIAAPGPYKYYIFEGSKLNGTGMSRIDSVSAIDTAQKVYNYYSKKLNTQNNAYTYSVVIFNDGPGKHFEIGASDYASSPFLNLIPSNGKMALRLKQNVPWTDTLFITYRKNLKTQLFDSIGKSRDTNYLDKNLINKIDYCYQIKTIGFYSFPELDTVFNYSQISCKAPIDDQAPCQPIVMVDANCDDNKITLNWTNPQTADCDQDIKYYKIYYAETTEEKLKSIDQIRNGSITTYSFNPTNSMAGCYAVSAVDSVENESKIDLKVCVDKCVGNYELPNVFTPDGDGTNDLLKPLKNKFVVKVDLKIYNRWGKLVFETQDPLVNWDGKLKGSNSVVPDGVYYYICDVSENRLSGLETRYISGFINVFANQKKAP